MNCLNVIARLGKDAELRHLANGTPVCQFTAAFDSGYGDNKATTWLQCALFGKRGETLQPMLEKGKQVGLTGEIKLDKWTNREGVEQQTLKMKVNDVTLLSRSESAGGGGNARPNENPAGGQGAGAPPQSGSFEDDIPFAQFDRGRVI